jgi:hypothetical protein
MIPNNIQKVLGQIRDSDLVVDIGGWAKPFNRANYVIDFQPYETRGKYGFVGDRRERFTKDTWIARDICDRAPFPFKDKEVDYAICSQVLEDIRDPIWVCAEINRIAKRGYIEVPSKIAELSLGIGSPRWVGYQHHRWIVEIADNKISFIFKPHFLHTCWKYHFPYHYGRRLVREGGADQYLFWENSFEFEEKIMLFDKLQREIEGIIKAEKVYMNYRYRMEAAKELIKRLRDKLRKTL